MKKILYTTLLFLLFIPSIKAFNIDVSKIIIGDKSTNLTKNLNSSYKIDTNGFNEEEIEDENIDKTIINLVSLSLSDKNKEEKAKSFTDYQYYSNDGGNTLATSILIQTYIDKLEELNLKATTIKDIRNVSFNDNDVLSFAYLSDATIKDRKDDVILIFWLKKDNNEYRVFYPWLTIGEDTNNFYRKVKDNESSGINISGTYRELSLDGKKHEINPEELNRIYQSNHESVVQITGMNKTGTNLYGSGFFLREGIIVTTWSLFQEFLNYSNYIYVNDSKGHTYKVTGIVAAEVNYDVVVLKLNENIGKGVILGDSTKLKVDDSLYMINSKNNDGFSISYGKFVTEKDGRLKNMLLLNSSDVGSPLFDKEGKVVGIASSTKLNSDLSYANSTNYLQKLQMILNAENYDKITYTVLETFKQAYYTKTEPEKAFNNVDTKVWDKYKKIGNIEENISLELIKATYVDKILSLRYKTDTTNMIDTMFFISSFTEDISIDGYKLVYEDDYKKIYQNNKYKIIIKQNLQYLIILMMGN